MCTLAAHTALTAENPAKLAAFRGDAVLSWPHLKCALYLCMRDLLRAVTFHSEDVLLQAAQTPGSHHACSGRVVSPFPHSDVA